MRKQHTHWIFASKMQKRKLILHTPSRNYYRIGNSLSPTHDKLLMSVHAMNSIWHCTVFNCLKNQLVFYTKSLFVHVVWELFETFKLATCYRFGLYPLQNRSTARDDIRQCSSFGLFLTWFLLLWTRGRVPQGCHCQEGNAARPWRARPQALFANGYYRTLLRAAGSTLRLSTST